VDVDVVYHQAQAGVRASQRHTERNINATQVYQRQRTLNTKTVGVALRLQYMVTLKLYQPTS